MRTGKDPLSVAKAAFKTQEILEADVIEVNTQTRRALIRFRTTSQTALINLGVIDPDAVMDDRARLLIYASPFGGTFPVGVIPSRPTHSALPSVTLGDKQGSTRWRILNCDRQEVFSINSLGEMIHTDSVTYLGYCIDPWALLGNAGTTPGTNFLGTTDNVALQLHVNGVRAMRYEPDAVSPNIIGGYEGNLATTTLGGTICGGGKAGGINELDQGNYGFIGGGYNNYLWGYQNVVVGGKNHSNEGLNAIIGGGAGNQIGVGSQGAVIAGGESNYVDGTQSAILGGAVNKVGTGPTANTYRSVIAGGANNTIGDGRNYCFIGGGFYNDCITSAFYAVVCGGWNNTASGSRAFVGGGKDNVASDQYAIVVGGYGNTASGNRNVIVGGSANVCSAEYLNTGYNFIGGGHSNDLTGTATASTIVCGAYNAITGGSRSAIVAGVANFITGSRSFIGAGDGSEVHGYVGAIVSGEYCEIASGRNYCFIGGGYQNVHTTLARMAGIVCGSGNEVQQEYGFIGGGRDNLVSSAKHGIIGGGRDNTTSALYTGVFTGRYNTASGVYSSIPGGKSGKADQYGQVAHASGKFQDDGDAQGTIQMVSRRQVTHDDDTHYELFLDGSSIRMAIAPCSVWVYDILLAGTSYCATYGFAYKLAGGIKNNAGTTTIFGGTVTTLGEDYAPMTAAAVADDVNDALAIEVWDLGQLVASYWTYSALTVRWVATTRLAQVTYNI